MSSVKDTLSDMTVVQLQKLAVELHLVGYDKTWKRNEINQLLQMARRKEEERKVKQWLYKKN